MGRLEGKVALITGAGSGIGRATALLFAREGAKVVAADISADMGEETVRMIRASGGAATFVKTDVTQEADVRHAVQTAVETYGRLQILFNNAGVPGPHGVVDVAAETWDKVMTVNVTGTFSGSSTACRRSCNREEAPSSAPRPRRDWPAPSAAPRIRPPKVRS